jgi:hypothetical protein
MGPDLIPDPVDPFGMTDLGFAQALRRPSVTLPA